MKTPLTFLALTSLLLVACNVTVDPSPSEDLTEKESLDTENTIDTVDSVDRPTEFTLGACVQNIYEENRMQYNSWEGVFTELFPELKVYDAGASCELTTLDETYYLVTFSYFNSDTANQMVALFDSDANLQNKAEFKCDTLGDLGYAKINNLSGTTLSLSWN